MKLTVEEKYSDKANPRYGYHDYICTLTFEPLDGMPIEEVQKEIVDLFLARRKSSFYMWLSQPKKTLDTPEKAIWSFNYGYDSGD